jgi:AraC-like DNA-binding protein
MKSSFDIFAVFYCAGFALAVFCALTLLGLKRGNRTANRILAVLLLLISIGVIRAILFHTRYIFSVPHLIGVTWPISFLYPPLFYLYVRSLILRDGTFKKQLFHFIPFILFALCLVPFYMRSGDYKVGYVISSWQSTPALHRVVSGLILLQELVYIVWSLRLLIIHSRTVKSVYSSIDDYNLRWIRSLIISYIIVTGLFFVLRFTNAPIRPIHVTPFVIVIFIYVLGFMGIRQPEIFSEIDGSRFAIKYSKSGLDTKKVDEYLNALLHVMEVDRLFIQSNLTLHKLADKLSISPNHLSQLLNERLNRSFFDFVNSYRVEEAKIMLRNPENNGLTMLAIAYEVGFSSKSSFNSVFRKHAKMTPSQYKLDPSGSV